MEFWEDSTDKLATQFHILSHIDIQDIFIPTESSNWIAYTVVPFTHRWQTGREKLVRGFSRDNLLVIYSKIAASVNLSRRDSPLERKETRLVTYFERYSKKVLK